MIFWYTEEAMVIFNDFKLSHLKECVYYFLLQKHTASTPTGIKYFVYVMKRCADYEVY